MALEGQTVRGGASIWPPFSYLDESTGEWSGYDIEVFKEAARRGKFNVEFIKLDSPSEDGTWDDVLLNQGRTMDILCTWWSETPARKQKGIAYTYPFLDQSLTLAAPVPKRVPRSFADKFWVFLQPFDRDLWLTLLFGNLFTAIVVFIMDPHIQLDPWTNAKGQRRMSETSYPTSGSMLEWCKYALVNISDFFYQGWVLGTVQDPFRHPRNFWMKIYLMSWTGVLIVLIAAYTAQLTSFLIIDSRPVDSIDSMEDVQDGNLPVCAAVSIPLVKSFMNSLASVPAVPLSTLGDALPGIRAGDCAAALAGKSELELLIANNEECDMRTVGRTQKVQNGAYPGDTSNCGSFVIHVISGLVQQIASEGLLDNMWARYTTKPAKCAWEQNQQVSKEDQKTPLPIKAMGGLFIIHAAFAFLALVGFSVRKFLQRKKGTPRDDSFFDVSRRGIAAGPWHKMMDSIKIPKSSSSQQKVIPSDDALFDDSQHASRKPGRNAAKGGAFGRTSTTSNIGDAD